MSFDLHMELQPAAIIALLAGCALSVVPRWAKLLAAGPVVVASDTERTFGVLVVALPYVAAGIYSPFLYFRF